MRFRFKVESLGFGLGLRGWVQDLWLRVWKFRRGLGLVFSDLGVLKIRTISWGIKSPAGSLGMVRSQQQLDNHWNLNVFCPYHEP